MLRRSVEPAGQSERGIRPSGKFYVAIDPLVTFDLAEDHRRGLAESVSAARFAIFVSVALGHVSPAGSRPGWGLHPKYP